jgi:hypothetical protein
MIRVRNYAWLPFAASGNKIESQQKYNDSNGNKGGERDLTKKP